MSGCLNIINHLIFVGKTYITNVRSLICLIEKVLVVGIVTGPGCGIKVNFSA